MKNRLAIAALLALPAFAYAQQPSQAAKDAVAAVTASPAVEAPKPPAPKYWTTSAGGNLSFVQTSFKNWAAGGENTATLSAAFNAAANYAKKEYYGNNKLQLNYGFLYGSSKPILQKNTDRIYWDCTWGRKVVKNLSFSANHNMTTQFTKGWSYATPATKKDDAGNTIEPTHSDWKDARKLLSNFLSPAYCNLALGIDYKPKPWLAINFAPCSGSYTIVTEETLRKSYGMEFNKYYKDLNERYGKTAPEELPSTLSQKDKTFLEAVRSGETARYLKSARFAFGTQLKLDIKATIDKKLTHSSTVILFSNYLDHPENIRVNWNSTTTYQFSKYLAITFLTWLTYDDKVMIFNEKDGLTKQRVQFKDQMSFALTYTFK